MSKTRTEDIRYLGGLLALNINGTWFVLPRRQAVSHKNTATWTPFAQNSTILGQLFIQEILPIFNESNKMKYSTSIIRHLLTKQHKTGGKSKGKRAFSPPTCRREHNIKMDPTAHSCVKDKKLSLHSLS